MGQPEVERKRNRIMNIDTMSLAEMLVKEQSEEVLKNYHQRIRQHIYSLENVRRDLSDSIAYGLDANDILVNLTQAIDFLGNMLNDKTPPPL